jgi:hypothetical protein
VAQHDARIIAVVGATGLQGGAGSGADKEPGGKKAQALAQLGAEVVKADVSPSSWEIFGRLAAQAALPTPSTIMIATGDPIWWSVSLASFGSLVAAERAGIPQLQVAIMTGRIGPGILGVVKESLADLSNLAGLLPERAAELLLQRDSLTSVPAGLDSGDLMLGEREAAQE